MMDIIARHTSLKIYTVSYGFEYAPAGFDPSLLVRREVVTFREPWMIQTLPNHEPDRVLQVHKTHEDVAASETCSMHLACGTWHVTWHDSVAFVWASLVTRAAR